jgi:tetratricopeptide (TPR) repeat protein
MNPALLQKIPIRQKNKQMRMRKVLLTCMAVWLIAPAAFSQTEVLKGVTNSLAFYKQKKDLKYLSAAQKTVDSLISASGDTLNLEHNVYKAVVYSSILYIDSVNKLNEPATMLPKTAALVDRLDNNRKIYRFQAEIDYSKRCLANAYTRKAFVYIKSSDFTNAMPLLLSAQKYAPAFKPLNGYIAYANNKLGNLHAAAKYYESLVGGDSTKAEYAEAASSIYKTFGDTLAALNIVKKARKVLPNDKSLLLDEANIYTNRKDYRALENLLPALLDINTNNADIAFVAANCYDHLNQYDRAESLYLRSIELNSSAYDPVFNLGLLYFRQSQSGRDKDKTQDEARAAQWLERANDINPNDINCLQVLKLVYAQIGDQNQTNKVSNKLKLLINQK